MNFELVIILLKGFSQVFFQENAWMGLIIAVGLTIASPSALLFAVIGGLITTLVSNFLGVNKALYEAGVATFNGILIGCAISFFVKSIPLSIVFVLIGSVIGGVIFYFLIKNHITPFALPFVTVAFITVFILNILKIH